MDLLRDLRAWRGSLEVAEVRLRHLEIGGGSKKEKINNLRFSLHSLLSPFLPPGGPKLVRLEIFLAYVWALWLYKC